MSVVPTLTQPACVDLEAWSTRMRVAVTDPSLVDVARDRTVVFLDAVDHACSRFRPDSDLSRVCARPGSVVPVGGILVAALEAALEAASATDGLVTPTVAGALEASGYSRTFALIGSGDPAALPQPVPVPAPDWRLVELDTSAWTVRVPSGTALDLGSTAKAWASDTLAGALASELGCGVLVSLGGDVAVAGPGPDRGWTVEVVDGAAAANPVVLLEQGALATSSTVLRRWTYGGRTAHHIIDPRTGEPADDVWRTVTVAAARCVDANTASTAAVVHGLDAPAWLEEVGLASRLVDRDGRVVTVAGWPGDE